jgi:hypothetical protein
VELHALGKQTLGPEQRAARQTEVAATAAQHPRRSASL